VLYPDIAGMVL